MSLPQPTFSGAHNEDADEYLETIEYNAMSIAAEEAKKLSMRVSFRSGLLGRAKAWYGTLDKSIRGDWDQLKSAFKAKYEVEVEDFDRKFLVQQEVYNLKQGEKETDTQYLKRIEKLNERCGAELHNEVARRTLGGLRDTELQYRVQAHLLANRKIDEEGMLVKDCKLKDVRSALIAATRLIGKPSPFDSDEKDDDEDPTMVTQAQINLDMLKLLKELRTGSTQVTTPSPPPYVKAVPPPNPFAAAPTNTAYMGHLTCYNCTKPGHTSPICPEPRVSEAQFRDNRARIDAARAQRTAYKQPNQGQVVSAHIVAPVQGQQHPSQSNYWTSYQYNHPARQPMSTSGGVATEEDGSASKKTPTVLGPVTPAILCRGYTAPINTIIPALPAEKTASRYKQQTRLQASGADYEAPRQTRSQAKQSSQPLRDESDEPGVSTMAKGKGREIDLTQTSHESTQTARATSPPPREHITENRNDRVPRQPVAAEESSTHLTRHYADIEEDMDENQPTNRNAPRRHVSAAEPSARTTQHFVDIDEDMNDAPIITRNAPVPQTKDARPTNKPKESIPIKLIEEAQIDRFDVVDFLANTGITLSIGQLLDRSPQCRAQLARLLQSSVPSRKPRRRNAVQAMAVARTSPPQVIDEGLSEADIVSSGCFYVQAHVDGELLHRCMVDSGAVAELIGPKAVKRLKLKVYQLEDDWYVKVADSRKVQIYEYVQIEVVVAGIRTYLRAFIMGLDDTYDLLLSRQWMARVGAIEDHQAGTLKIRGKSGIEVNVPAAVAPPASIEVIPDSQTTSGFDINMDSLGRGDSSDEDDGDAEEEIQKLLTEVAVVDTVEYHQLHGDSDRGKASRQ